LIDGRLIKDGLIEHSAIGHRAGLGEPCEGRVSTRQIEFIRLILNFQLDRIAAHDRVEKSPGNRAIERRDLRGVRMVLESLNLALVTNGQNPAHREKTQTCLWSLFIRVGGVELETCLERLVAFACCLTAKLQNRTVANR
jgi:hypothetical protein